jgi:transcriptional regulator with XRE-family HTH domain
MTEFPQPAGIPEWTLGWRLKRSLAYAGISVEQMSDYLGVSRSSVSRWLNDRDEPRSGFLRVWALRCGVPYTWLRDGTIPPDGMGSIIARCLTLPDRAARERAS